MPTKTLAISPMKDEGPYILEWLAFHRAIGITDFLIYTNDCSDGTDLILDRLQENGIVRHERNIVLRRGPHKSALKYAMEHEAFLAADWVFVCDVDEFLNIKIGDASVRELIDRFPNADAIPITWRMFSNNGHKAQFPGYCINCFTDAEPAEPEAGTKGRFVKSLFKPHPEIERLGLHGPVYNEAYEAETKWQSTWLENDPASNPKRPKENFGYEIAQVNHYAVRSIDAFLIKRDRGRANHTDETLGLKYWERWCVGGEEDRSIQRHEKAMLHELDHLMSDPIVRHLHEGAIEFHEQKLDKLLEREDFQTLRNELVAHTTAQSNISSSTKNPETQELAIKSPKRHQNRLRLLEKMPKGGRCAEIGVWNGGFSGAILEVTEPEELTLIDPWDLLSDQGEAEWTHKKHQDHDEMTKMFDHVTARYQSLENVSIRKGFSADVLNSFPDDYFDWIYIDGNHLYDFVRKDLALGFRKVKPGGMIAGDDFFWKRDGRMHVREAVLDEMRAQGMTNRPTRFGQQFMIRVPELAGEKGA